MENETKTEAKIPSDGKTAPRRRIDAGGDRLLREIEDAVPVNISACYQCERCTNSCPVAEHMDVKPHQVIRHVQLGWRRELLASSTIWVCLSCEMCTTYCPNEVGVAETVNHLRTMAFRSAAPPRDKILAAFHETFIGQLQRFGRVNEVWLMAALNAKPGVLKEKWRRGMLIDELHLGLEMWKRGKLRLIPHRCREMAKIREVCRREQGGRI